MSSKRATIAKNIALMLHDGDVVNLGIGLPTMVSNYLPAGMTILLHGENGCIGQDRELPYACDFNDRDSVTAYLRAHDDAHGGWPPRSVQCQRRFRPQAHRGPDDGHRRPWPHRPVRRQKGARF